LIADDHRLVRAGLRMLIGTMDGIRVVAEAEDGNQALAMVQEHQPELALIDISMPVLNGLETTARIVRNHPRTRVLILTMHSGGEYLQRSLAAGASGYLLKNSDQRELEMALRAVGRGDVWLSPAISRSVILALQNRDGAQPEPFDKLTPRQREILQLIGEGHSTKDIAQQLKLSVKTVETHRAQLMDRLGVRGIPALVRYAIRIGIVRPEP
jgi:DNA-binding NarL/FixJ family response regulator